jgi:hypothetical protein
MSRGYLAYAVGKECYEQAYLLALSLAASGNKEPFSLITDQITNEEDLVFDQLIPAPDVIEPNGKLHALGRTYSQSLSPYDETIMFDTDVIVMQNLSHIWDFYSYRDICYLNTIYDYRGQPIVNDCNRKATTSNNLPNVYCGMHYFCKSEGATQFYNQLTTIAENWEKYYSKFFRKNKPDYLSMDFMLAIAMQMYGPEHLTASVPRFVHMKPRIQGWQLPAEKWIDRTSYTLTPDLNLSICGWPQHTVFHYVESEFVTAELVQIFEEKLLELYKL